jgi:magnesium transporter
MLVFYLIKNTVGIAFNDIINKKPEAKMSNSSFYNVSLKGEITSLKSAEDVLGSIGSGGYAWLNYIDPSPEELNVIKDRLNLDSLSIEDCFDDNTIPKVNEFKDYTFFIFNICGYSEGELEVNEINMFLGNNYVITVCKKDISPGHPMFEIENHVRLNINNVKNSPAFLLHVLLDIIVDNKGTAIDAFEDELIEIENTINFEYSNFNPMDLQRLRRILLTLRKGLYHEREILFKICRGDIESITDREILYYRDIYDHVLKLFELVEMDREIVTSLMQINLSIINNRITESANKTNVFIRRLTMISTIFMPLTLIAGIGGMSEFTMMAGSENWKIAYIALFAIMAAVGFVNYIFLKRAEKKDKKRAECSGMDKKI